MMTSAQRYLVLTILFPLAAFLPAPGPLTRVAQASEIEVIVNNFPVTSYDIKRRAAFLRLQHKSTAGAKQEMIDQALRSVEMQRLHIIIDDKAIDAAYERFAKGNKMSVKQLDNILAQTGVTRDHFREFIRVQMGWGQAIAARARAEQGTSTKSIVEQMLDKNGEKPKATEYLLQQVIFVVPPSERKAILGKRKRQAEAMRARFNNCDTTRQFAKGLIDVTVRDLGRVLEPELPPEWAEPIKNTKPGSATKIRETPRGVEFIGICSEREVSDDRVARLLFQTEGDEDKKAEELSKKYMAELKEKARIVER